MHFINLSGYLAASVQIKPVVKTSCCTATIVPAPTASQFSREMELEDIGLRMAESLMSIRERPSTAHRSLETISELQDLDIDLEVVFPHVGVGCGHLPYMTVDPNSTTLPIDSTPGIDASVIGIQFAEYLFFRNAYTVW